MDDLIALIVTPRSLAARLHADSSSSRFECVARVLEKVQEDLVEGAGITAHPGQVSLDLQIDTNPRPLERMAEELGSRFGKELSSAGVRQLLHRARERFADRLLDEVANSLQSPTAEELEEELIDLGLLEHCRPALESH